MTFFLSNPGEVQEIKPTGPDQGPTGYWSGVAAATDKMMLETDAFMQHDSAVKGERLFAAEPAARRLGIDALNQRYEATGAGYDHLRPAPTTVDDFFAMHGDEGTQIALDLAREAAEATPDAWADLDLTDDGIDTRATEQRKRRHEGLTEALEMMPSGRTTAELIGGMIGATADPRNVPFLLAGAGGGSILRIMGREAVLNGAAEAWTLPSQYKVADELGIPDPDPIKQIAIGAAAGGVLGGATAAIGRAVSYFNGRSRTTAPDPYRAAAEDAAEDAIVKGENPLTAVQRVMDRAPPLVLAPEARVDRAPLIPKGVTSKTPEPTALAPEPITSEVLPPPAAERPDTPGEIAAVAERAINDADATVSALEAQAATAKENDAKALRPLIQAMRRTGKKGGALMQVHPDGAFGKELKARGINAKTYPGMFSKNGLKDMDNLVASEMERSLPGISAAAGIADDGIYLNRDGLLALIEREHRGDSSWLYTREARQYAEAELDAHLRWVEEGSPVDDLLSKERSDDGFYVDLDGQYFDPNFIKDAEWEAGVERGFDGWIAQRGYRLLDDERAEILAELKERGGDAEYLVEQAFERDRAEITDSIGSKADDDDDFFPFGDESDFARGAPEESAGGSRGAGEQPEPVAADDGAGREASVEPAGVERTEAGDQLVIPGAERRDAPSGMTERQRAEMQARSQQSKIRRLDQQRVEDDAIGLFSPQQRSMFDDPTGPQARPAQDAIAADIRDQIAKNGDFTIDMSDGRGEVKASSLLDELDADDDFSAIIDLCGKGKA